MNQLVVAPLLLACCFLALFGFAEFLYHKRKLGAEWTRKIVHIGTGLLTLLFPVFLDSHWQVLFLCGSFLVILLASLQFHFLPSINGIDRRSYGSILFPIVVYGCFLVYVLEEKGTLLFYLPILIMAICDPVAAFFGKKYPYGSYRVGRGIKTLSGSAAFFVSCFLVTAATFYLFDMNVTSTVAVLLVLVPVVATVSEAVGSKGTDNFTLPASVLLTLDLIL